MPRYSVIKHKPQTCPGTASEARQHRGGSEDLVKDYSLLFMNSDKDMATTHRQDTVSTPDVYHCIWLTCPDRRAGVACPPVFRSSYTAPTGTGKYYALSFNYHIKCLSEWVIKWRKKILCPFLYSVFSDCPQGSRLWYPGNKKGTISTFNINVKF